MEIAGVGIDIVRTERLYRDLERKILSDHERTLMEKVKNPRLIREFLAARWAVKEAFVKALGTGFRGVTPKEVTLRHDENGRPILEYPERLGDLIPMVSISHDGEYTVAVVILIKSECSSSRKEENE